MLRRPHDDRTIHEIKNTKVTARRPGGDRTATSRFLQLLQVCRTAAVRAPWGRRKDAVDVPAYSDIHLTTFLYPHIKWEIIVWNGPKNWINWYIQNKTHVNSFAMKVLVKATIWYLFIECMFTSRHSYKCCYSHHVLNALWLFTPVDFLWNWEIDFLENAFGFRFYWNLFLMVQRTVSQPWFRW